MKTCNLAPEYLLFIDPQLSLQVVNFLSMKGTNDELLQLKKNLLFKTYLFEKQTEFIEDLKKNQIDGNLVSDMDLELIQINKENVVKEESELKFFLTGFLNLIHNCSNINNFDLNAFSLGKKIMDETSPEKILEYSRLLYNCGRFEEAKYVLTGFTKLSEGIKKNASKVILALWLIFSINILMKNEEEIHSSFIQMKKSIENLKEMMDEEFKKLNFDTVERLQVDFRHVLLYRSYIIHWALFLLTSNDQLKLYIDLIFDVKYLPLIESSFQYMFKYLVVFTVISKSKHYLGVLKEALGNFDSEDKFVCLFHSIYNNFDVEASLRQVGECMELMKEDYFLHFYLEKFNSKCKEVIMENYILLNESIDLKYLQNIFDNDIKATKKFVVDLINVNFPETRITEKDDVISYSVTNTDFDIHYVMQAQEIFDVTQNMIQLLKLNK